MTRNSRYAGSLESLVRRPDLELHLFTLSERLEPLHRDRGKVYKHVFTVGLFNEALTLRVIEPLHFTNGHRSCLLRREL